MYVCLSINTLYILVASLTYDKKLLCLYVYKWEVIYAGKVK